MGPLSHAKFNLMYSLDSKSVESVREKFKKRFYEISYQIRPLLVNSRNLLIFLIDKQIHNFIH